MGKNSRSKSKKCRSKSKSTKSKNEDSCPGGNCGASKGKLKKNNEEECGPGGCGPEESKCGPGGCGPDKSNQSKRPKESQSSSLPDFDESETESVGTEQSFCIYHNQVLQGIKINGKLYGKKVGQKICVDLQHGDYVRLATWRETRYQGAKAVTHLRLYTKKKKNYYYYGTSRDGSKRYRFFGQNDFHRNLKEVNDRITEIRGGREYRG